jgi:predicted DCC family thiol-disulfide oxidoreductase YuxK
MRAVRVIESSLLRMPPPILLYDGVCGLCNRLVQFILHRDRHAIFRFASLQSPLAARILVRHGADPADLDTVYVVLNHDQSDESLLARSDAVVFILKQLGGVWRTFAFLSQRVPRLVRDWAYRLVARHRYRIFGRYDTCPLPTEATRARFLDL